MEVVAIIVIAGAAIPTLLAMWSSVSWQAVRSESLADASFFASGLMEEVVSRRFDENIASPRSATLGSDSAETSSNAATFDDVDDFVGATDAAVTTPAPGFIRSVSVAYVVPNGSGGWDNCPGGSCSNVEPCPSCCTTCAQCCYKRVTVTVARSDALPVSVSLSTIISGY
jgi:hypothetical protein